MIIGQRAAVFIKMKPQIAKEVLAIASEVKAAAKEKRSEAAVEQHKVSNPRRGEMVEPQTEAQPEPKKQSKKNRTTDTLAETSGVSRSELERQEHLRKVRRGQAALCGAARTSLCTTAPCSIRRTIRPVGKGMIVALASRRLCLASHS
jgi:hypothetical protein